MENKFNLGDMVMHYDGNDVAGPFKVIYVFDSGAVELEDGDDSFIVTHGCGIVFYDSDKCPLYESLAKGFVREVHSDQVPEIVAYREAPEEVEEELGYFVYTHDSLSDLVRYEMYFLDDVDYEEVIRQFYRTFGYYGDDAIYYHPDTKQYSWVSYF